MSRFGIYYFPLDLARLTAGWRVNLSSSECRDVVFITSGKSGGTGLFFFLLFYGYNFGVMFDLLSLFFLALVT